MFASFFLFTVRLFTVYDYEIDQSAPFTLLCTCTFTILPSSLYHYAL